MSRSAHDEITRIEDLIEDGKAINTSLWAVPVDLEVTQVPRRKGRLPHHKIHLTAGQESQDLDIYVSPTGGSVRVFRNGDELT